MTDVLMWGILGTARINRKVMPGFRAGRGMKLLGIASRDRHRAEEYAAENDIPRAYAGYEELLADPKIDCVYIPLPNHLHAEWSIRAVEAGKHVLCEKPFTMNAAEADAVADASRRTGRLVMEAFMYRFHPQWARIRAMVEGGEIGELKIVRAQMGGHMRDFGDIRMKPEMGGGALMDIGCYCLNACRQVTRREPTWLVATANYERGVDVMLTALLRFPGDVLGEFNCGFRSNPHNDVEIIGTEASVHTGNPWGPGPEEPITLTMNRDNRVETVTIPPSDEYLLQAEHFCDAVRGRAPLEWGIDDAARQMRGMDALAASARTSEPVILG